MKLFDDLLEKSAQLADQASKFAGEALEQSKVAAGEAVDKGKKKMEQISLESDMSKAQKQLGALVYMMHKTGEKNDELIQQYIDEIAAIEKKIEALGSDVKAAMNDFSLDDIQKAAEDLVSNVEEKLDINAEAEPEAKSDEEKPEE